MRQVSLWCVLVLFWFFSACSSAQKSHSRPDINDSRLTEISGLANSIKMPGAHWVLNDSGNPAEIFLLDQALRTIRIVPLAVSNRDWESLASLQWQGESWLALADFGDNKRHHPSYYIHLFRESDLLGSNQLSVKPVFSLNYRYQDGAYNAEAMVADPISGVILIFTKEAPQSRVYSLPLTPPDSASVLTATYLTTLPELSSTPDSRLLMRLTGINLEQVTGAGLGQTGRTLCLLTYRDVWCYEKKEVSQAWKDVLARTPRRLSGHGLRQAEAMTVSADDLFVTVTTEGIPAKVKIYPVRHR